MTPGAIECSPFTQFNSIEFHFLYFCDHMYEHSTVEENISHVRDFYFSIHISSNCGKYWNKNYMKGMSFQKDPIVTKRMNDNLICTYRILLYRVTAMNWICVCCLSRNPKTVRRKLVLSPLPIFRTPKTNQIGNWLMITNMKVAIITDVHREDHTEAVFIEQ